MSRLRHPHSTARVPVRARSERFTRPLSGASEQSSECSSQRSSIRARPPRDTMCKSWRLRKSCPRLDKGLQCDFDHPADFSVQPKTCHQFTNMGHCTQGSTCRYEHSTEARAARVLAEAKPAELAVVPVAAPSAAPASLQPENAAVSEQAASTAASPAPISSPPRRKRKPDEEDSAGASAEPTVPRSSHKKSKSAAASRATLGLAASSNIFSALGDELEDDAPPVGESPVRMSSLSGLMMAKPAASPSPSKKKKSQMRSCSLQN